MLNEQAQTADKGYTHNFGFRRKVLTIHNLKNQHVKKFSYPSSVQQEKSTYIGHTGSSASTRYNDTQRVAYILLFGLFRSSSGRNSRNEQILMANYSLEMQ
jgi:hypothetical protein